MLGGRVDLDQREADVEAEHDQQVDWLADTLVDDIDLRRRVASIIVGATPAIRIEHPHDRLAMLNVTAAAAYQLGAPGECRMATPAGILRPVLKPSVTDSRRAELYWCCTGHSEEHCSQRADG